MEEILVTPTNVEEKVTDDVFEFIVTEAHYGQTRDNSAIPYSTHCISVYKLLATRWCITDNPTLLASLAHDVFEMCPHISRERLIQVIGESEVGIVEELTFIPDQKFVHEGISASEQKAKYIKSFWNKSVRALVIKLADRCENTMDFYNMNSDYAGKYWKKASSLCEAVISRHTEIEELYGIGTMADIRYTIQQIGQMVQ